MYRMSAGRGNLLIIAIILGLSCLACDGFSRISGHVYDEQDKPIAGVSVSFESVVKGDPASSYQESTQTNQSGRFSLGFVDSPFEHKLILSARKEGYKPFAMEKMYSEIVQMMKDQHEVKVV